MNFPSANIRTTKLSGPYVRGPPILEIGSARSFTECENFQVINFMPALRAGIW